MIRSGALSAALSAAFFFATPASAAPKAKPAASKAATAAAPAAQRAPATSSATGTVKPAATIGWANIGIYDVRISVDTGFGTFSSSDAEFGIGAGFATNVAQLSPDVPLAVFGNAAISFASGGQFFPLTGGVAARYDKLPVQLLGGIGLTLMPNSAGSDTGIGAGILLMGLYPLQQVDPRLSVQGQIQFHLLNHSMSLLEFLIGVGYAL